MNSHRPNQSRELINKEKWWDILSRFINVLRVNISIIDPEGRIVLPPDESKFGGRLMTKPEYKVNLLGRMDQNVLDQFEPNGKYYECELPYDLRCFAIKIEADKGQVIGYMIVGPVVLGRSQLVGRYEEIAKERGVDPAALLAEIRELRNVSHLMMNSILDLLNEIVRDNIELSIKEKELSLMKLDPERGASFKKAAREIIATVQQDELLVTMLDWALKITDAEAGSVMMMDDETKTLSVRVSRGIDEKCYRDRQIPLGDGISGIAAQHNEVFYISPKGCDSKIAHLLKRPQIKESVVIPLSTAKRVFGVMNLHTQKVSSQIEDNLENLRNLSRLLTSAF